MATKGRKWGVHLVIATQRPSNRVVHEEIRASIPATIAFAVRDKKNSAILNVKGAETIGVEQKGLAIFAHGSRQIFAQTPLYKPKDAGKREYKPTFRTSKRFCSIFRFPV